MWNIYVHQHFIWFCLYLKSLTLTQPFTCPLWIYKCLNNQEKIYTILDDSFTVSLSYNLYHWESWNTEAVLIWSSSSTPHTSFLLHYSEILLLKLMSFFICSCRPISDVSSDLTVQVGSSSFCLHKVKNKNKKHKNLKTENPLFLSCIEVACLLFW